MSELDRLTLSLTERLIGLPSVSPEDGGCQEIIAAELRDMGFEIESMPFADVSNLWAVRQGSQASPMLVFAGHTDVVPPGPEADWRTPPFEPVTNGDMLTGRGAADMKGSLAAMVTGIRRFLADNPDYPGSLALLITSDEEADAVNGTVQVIKLLTERGISIDWCVIGEPSSSRQLGDVIRVGRRGSLNGTLTVKGLQGHVAYPDEARNPIHESLSALSILAGEIWDEGNAYFPPTSMQISNINAGTGATNVIPGDLTVRFNFRFSTESTADSLQSRTEAILDTCNLDYHVNWQLSGQPFITSGGALIPAVQQAIRTVCGIETELSTSGGTSDGRFIAPFGIEVVELGPVNETIHKVNESVSRSDLLKLSRLYTAIISLLLGKPR